MEGVATTHRETADGTTLTFLNSAIVGVDVVHDVHKAFWNGGNGRSCGTSASVAEARRIHTERPLTRRCLTIGITIWHHDNHRLSLARRNEVVENLCGTTEFTPGILVATRTVQQIHHGILAAFVITGGRIDGHTTLHLQRGAGIPDFQEIAVRYLVHLIQVALIALLLADDEDIGERHDVAVHIDVGRIFHACQAVNIKGVTVHLWSQFVARVAPHAVLAFYKFCNARGIILAIARHINLMCRQKVASHLNLDGFGGKNIKRHCAVRVDDG